VLKPSEIHRLVYDYIGVDSGYLCGFSYRTHREFYPNYCELDIDPDGYEGSTRAKFTQILREANATDQIKILEGLFKKSPVVSFSDTLRPQRQVIYDEFQQVIARLKAEIHKRGGAEGEVKNIIFAANGPKPDIVLTDTITNAIAIVSNAEFCLVYDRPIPPTGLSWQCLIQWWAEFYGLPYPDEKTERSLEARLHDSLGSQPERLLFHTYLIKMRPLLGDLLPALVPQVYLHYDPRTLAELNGHGRLSRQRMDFLILFSENERVVIEVDGKQHYADGENASPRLYAEMVAADRQLRLSGYEIYRFGGYELHGKAGQTAVEDFFRKLIRKHTGANI
jgi:very-short-patch-repair endonuclease